MMSKKILRVFHAEKGTEIGHYNNDDRYDFDLLEDTVEVGPSGNLKVRAGESLAIYAPGFWSRAFLADEQ